MPSEYINGYLTGRCWFDSECKTELLDAMEIMTGRFESMDLITEIQRVYALIRDEKYNDPRHPWSTDQFESEFDCMESWVQSRPAAIYSFVENQR
jgi:hypothetical protein